jgi:hypothetical protein
VQSRCRMADRKGDMMEREPAAQARNTEFPVCAAGSHYFDR